MRKVLLSLLFLIPSVAFAQQNLPNPTPTSGQFVVTASPYKDGVRATADLPTSQHHRNTGGNDRTRDNPRGEPGKGYGLCVYTSVWHCAIWQAISELYGFRDWMQNHPGGSYPDKFEATLNDYCKEKGIPCPSYIQHTGGDEDFLELAIQTGRMVGVTYCGVDGAGRYGNEVIGHMVSLVHFDKTTAAILDNNFPGNWLWMSRADFLCRHRGIQSNGKPYLGRNGSKLEPIGGGWSIVFLKSPPAPYPAPPPFQFGASAPCICGDSCKCDAGKCPGSCPVLVGQLFRRQAAQPVSPCPGGVCPVPGIQPAPSIANPFGPVFLPPGEIVVPEPMPAEQLPTPNRLPNASELAQKPGADFLWRNIPGLGIGWILPSPDFNWGKTATGWGWIKTKPEAAPVTVPTFPPTQALSEFPERGVEPSPPDMEKKFWCNGVRSTPEQIAARLNLTDDSTRWNLSVVGDPSFQRQVRDDVAALPVDIREKLHVQTYIPTGWEPAQFKLATGLNLRRPAVCRVGADLGTVAVTDYTPTKLAELMTVPSGPKPKPIQPPEPKPVPPNVEPTPAPTASTTNPIVFLAIAAVIVFLLVKGR